MSIPQFGLGEVLPPFLGEDVTGAAALPRSPYRASIVQVVVRFCTSPERAAILEGLIAFRSHLRDLGFCQGFQWIDGSFVENCEVTRGRAPGDVDVVSLLHRPEESLRADLWEEFFVPLLPTTFNSDWTKANFRCDAYHIDLDEEATSVAELVAYWWGLFSHQRETFVWKGLVQIPFLDDDAAALALIAELRQSW